MSGARESDVAALAVLRERRREVIEAFARGRSMRSLVAEFGTGFIGDTRVVKVLEARSAVGKVLARRLLNEAGLPADARIRTLTEDDGVRIDRLIADPRRSRAGTSV